MAVIAARALMVGSTVVVGAGEGRGATAVVGGARVAAEVGGPAVVGAATGAVGEGWRAEAEEQPVTKAVTVRASRRRDGIDTGPSVAAISGQVDGFGQSTHKVERAKRFDYDKGASGRQDFEAEYFGNRHLVVVEGDEFHRPGQPIRRGKMNSVGHAHRVSSAEFAGMLKAERVDGNNGDSAPVVT